MQPIQGLDWFSLSKLNHQQIDLQKLHLAVRDSLVSRGIDKVTVQHRKKLLILFQNASHVIKKESAHLLAEHSDLRVKRNMLADKLALKQEQVEGSFKQLSNIKLVVEEKKRLLNKLRERVLKSKSNTKKYYCCSLCDRKDFSSPSRLKQHVQADHQLPKGGETGLGPSQVDDLKDLIVTMKDKEMEMMSMLLRASRQMQTQKLQEDYKNEYRKYMQVSAAKTEESKQEPQVEQLKGSSQFLFFQRAQPLRRQIDRDQSFINQLAKQKQNYALEREFFQQDKYYNVFANVQDNLSESLEQPERNPTEQSLPKQQSREQHSQYDPNQLMSRFVKEQGIGKQSKLNLVENGTPKPMKQLKQTKLVQKEAELVGTSISDRLRIINQYKKDAKNQSMFSTKRKFHEDCDFVFNSGPLLQDKGGDSDYEDYFGKNLAYSQSVEDEQIKLQPKAKEQLLVNSSKESINFSKLLSPNSFMQKSKDSVIVDLSDSFSKRDVELSKDETINLSDLKLSKLQRRKEQQRALQVKATATESHSNTASITVSQERTHENKNYEFLREFQREKIAPLKQENYRFEQMADPIKPFLKPNSHRSKPKESSLQTNTRPSILNEFLRRQTVPSPPSLSPQALLDEFSS